MKPPDIAQRKAQSDTFLLLARIAALAERRALRLFESVGLTDITPTQSRVLMILFHARGPMTASEISAALGLTEVTVGRFIRALIGAGWLTRERDPADRRAWLLRPTDKARAQLPQLIAVSNTLLDEVFGVVEPAEFALLADVLGRIQGSLGRE